MTKVLITPRSFAEHDVTPLRMLEEKGYELIRNPYGRIMNAHEMQLLIGSVDGIILGVDPCDKEVMSCAEKLRVISRYGVGMDNIDLDYAKERGIQVFRTVGANSDAVADYAFGLMLDLTRKITFIDRACREGNWKKIKTSEMNKKVLGVVGLGAIGKGVARRSTGFDMKVLAYDPYEDQDYAAAHNIEYVSLDRLLKESDFISLHLPLTEQTHHLIGARQFQMMKSTAILVNTARGGIVDEAALYQALKNKQIMAAGIDVFDSEPPKNTELMACDNLVVGAHCAASSLEAIDNMSLMAAENLIAGFEKG